MWVWVCVGFFFHNSNRFNFFASFFVWGYFRTFFCEVFFVVSELFFPSSFAIHIAYCTLHIALIGACLPCIFWRIFTHFGELLGIFPSAGLFHCLKRALPSRPPAAGAGQRAAHPAAPRLQPGQRGRRAGGGRRHPVGHDAQRAVRPQLQAARRAEDVVRGAGAGGVPTCVSQNKEVMHMESLWRHSVRGVRSGGEKGLGNIYGAPRKSSLPVRLSPTVVSCHFDDLPSIGPRSTGMDQGYESRGLSGAPSPQNYAQNPSASQLGLAESPAAVIEEADNVVCFSLLLCLSE